jgi:hypothetical protein
MRKMLKRSLRMMTLCKMRARRKRRMTSRTLSTDSWDIRARPASERGLASSSRSMIDIHPCPHLLETIRDRSIRRWHLTRLCT